MHAFVREPLAAPRSLIRLAWWTLGFTVAVIAMGAVVRATGSGDGCGANWPTCQGSVLPLDGTGATLVEFTHRATSGIALVIVVALFLMVRRSLPGGHPSRRYAAAAVVLISAEALIGLALVRNEWVGENASVARAIVVGGHLLNTFLLLAALTLTAWALTHGPDRRAGKHHRMALLTTGLLLLVGATGAVTALGDTLFPAESITSGIIDDFTAASFLVRLRWIHPIIAVVTAAVALHAGRRMTPPDGPRAVAGRWLKALVITQVGIGVVNVGLLAPVWMQVVHLLTADAVWISFVALAAEEAGLSMGAKAP